jgi:23S rRNA (guanosine2251-2'-O)-methyltransferase
MQSHWSCNHVYYVSMSRIIYGVNPVFEALTHLRGKVRRVVLDRKRRERLGRLATLAHQRHLHVEWADKNALDKIAGDVRHQGAICLADDFDYTSLKDFLAADHPEGRTVVAADGIEDPQNLGAILRAMGAFGANLLLLKRHHAAPITPTVVKVSAGAAGVVDVARESSIPNALDRLKKGGFWVYGLEADGESTLQSQKLTGNLVFVVGSEGRGLSRLVREKCDVICRIPLAGELTSLNAASSVVCSLYETARQSNS